MAKSGFIPSQARIKVIGLGGAGCNAVTRMVREQIMGVEFIAMNTDAQQLQVVEAPVRIQLGEQLTKGQGAGGDHTRGRRAAEESRAEIVEAVSGADMVFITAGMGGGSGTGSAPVVAECAKASGALTIAIVTKPFGFEGTHRTKVAEEGINNLMPNVDTLIIVPNDRVLQMVDRKTGVDNAFRIADEVLQQGVQAITEVITEPGIINLDFADVRSIMKDAGPAWMAVGHGTGANRAVDAARMALCSPLLDVSLEGATGVLFNVTGSSDLSLCEVSNAAEVIRAAVDPDANVIFGVAVDPNMNKDVRITLVATGFASKEGMANATREREIGKLLKNTKENEFDIPAYVRQSSLPGRYHSK